MPAAEMKQSTITLKIYHAVCPHCHEPVEADNQSVFENDETAVMECSLCDREFEYGGVDE